MIAHGSVSQVPAPVPMQSPAPRRPWYRRPARVIPLAILAILIVAAGIIGYRTLAAFDTVHSLSTPPPAISDAALGGDGQVVIDTGPAREAVRQQQERDRQQDPAAGNQVAPAATEPGANQPVLGTDEPPSATGLPPVFGPALTPAPSGTVADESTVNGPDAITASPTPVAPVPTGVVFGPLPSATSVPASGQAGGTTVLLMGVDARDGEAIDVGVRPDALAVLHIDDSGACRMLAIPRDSRAELPGYGQSKINHALAVGGIPYQLQVVEGYLGLDIDHYGLVDFAGVTQIVDSIGGITVDNPGAFTIDGQDFAAGPIRLDGERALLYARYRGGADGDFGRIAKQQQVLRAVMDRATEVNLVTLVPKSFSLLADHIRTDFGPTELVSLATDYLDTCTAVSLDTATIPGDVSMQDDDLMQMTLSFVVSDPAAVQDHVDWLLGRD